MNEIVLEAMKNHAKYVIAHPMRTRRTMQGPITRDEQKRIDATQYYLNEAQMRQEAANKRRIKRYQATGIINSQERV